MSEHGDRVATTVEGAVATIRITRPERMNALDTRTLLALGDAIIRVRTDPAIRSALLTGEGRAFSAGADVKEWAAEDPEPSPGELSEDWVSLSHRVMSSLYRVPKPVIAAVNGVAVGAGLDFALACDFRFASEQARFGSVYIRLGFPPDAGASFFLPRIVGIEKAKELIYTGRIIDAAEALRIGMVSRVVPADQLHDEALEFASQLAAGPTIAIGLAKENIQEHWLASIESALKSEQRAGRNLRSDR